MWHRCHRQSSKVERLGLRITYTTSTSSCLLSWFTSSLHIITSSQPLFSLSPSITSSAFHVPGLNPIMFHESFPSFIAFLVPFGLPSVHRSWTWTGVTRQWRLFVLVCLFYLFIYFWLRVLDQTILTVVFSVHVKLSVYRIVWYRMHQEIVHDFYRYASQTICCSLTLAGLEGAPGVRSFFRNLYTVTGGKFWHQQIFKHHCTCTARSSFFQSELLTFGTLYPLVKLIFLPWSSLNVLWSCWIITVSCVYLSYLLDTFVFVLCLLFT